MFVLLFSGATLAERRKQLIQESKYLGGDMEHTHLVKGLDYALLEKVRAEISFKELEDEQGMEVAISEHRSVLVPHVSELHEVSVITACQCTT